MRKEVLQESDTKPEIINNNPPTVKIESVSENASNKDILDKIDVFDPTMGLVPGYSDFYEENDELERNEDTFAPEID
jgi:hypothetical protein